MGKQDDGRLICDDCECEDPDVEETFCPYSLEVHGEEVLVVLCPKCRNERRMDT